MQRDRIGREVRGEWGGERELWFDSALAAAVKVHPFSLIGSKGCAKEKHSSIVTRDVLRLL